MWEALREGLDEEMERDPTVCLMGAHHGCGGNPASAERAVHALRALALMLLNLVV